MTHRRHIEQKSWRPKKDETDKYSDKIDKKSKGFDSVIYCIRVLHSESESYVMSANGDEFVSRWFSMPGGCMMSANEDEFVSR
jgi:hypothetical protein